MGSSELQSSSAASQEVTEPFDARQAYTTVHRLLISRLPGDPWKSSQAVIEEIRKEKIPALLSGVQE